MCCMAATAFVIVVMVCSMCDAQCVGGSCQPNGTPYGVYGGFVPFSMLSPGAGGSCANGMCGPPSARFARPSLYGRFQPMRSQRMRVIRYR